MKVYLDSVGCRLNQSEIEMYASQFRSAGHTLVPSADMADLVVVNTCSVTNAAAADSRKRIRQASRIGNGKIIATGCWATLEPQAAAELPGVTDVFENAIKDDLVKNLIQVDGETWQKEPLSREPIPGSRSRTRAFIKVQDGCDNKCTFCITTVARGPGRSRSFKDILRDVNVATSGGAKEIVLTGVHLGSWGVDFETPQNLMSLVKLLLKETDVPRIRLSSLEPWDIPDDFFTLWSNSRLARHLHLPLQSGAKATLRRMARNTTPIKFAGLVKNARQAIKGVSITTDIIAGFPGESDDDFKESADYVSEMAFAGGHVFTYSARPGTAAHRMSNQVPYDVRKDRNAAMRDILQTSAYQFNQRYLGKQLEILWEDAIALSDNEWKLKGISDNYIKVAANWHDNLWNQVSKVELIKANGKGLLGQIVDVGET